MREGHVRNHATAARRAMWPPSQATTTAVQIHIVTTQPRSAPRSEHAADRRRTGNSRLDCGRGSGSGQIAPHRRRTRGHLRPRTVAPRKEAGIQQDYCTTASDRQQTRGRPLAPFDHYPGHRGNTGSSPGDSTVEHGARRVILSIVPRADRPATRGHDADRPTRHRPSPRCRPSPSCG